MLDCLIEHLVQLMHQVTAIEYARQRINRGGAIQLTGLRGQSRIDRAQGRILRRNRVILVRQFGVQSAHFAQTPQQKHAHADQTDQDAQCDALAQAFGAQAQLLDLVVHAQDFHLAIGALALLLQFEDGESSRRCQSEQFLTQCRALARIQQGFAQCAATFQQTLHRQISGMQLRLQLGAAKMLDRLRVNAFRASGIALGGEQITAIQQGAADHIGLVHFLPESQGLIDLIAGVAHLAQADVGACQFKIFKRSRLLVAQGFVHRQCARGVVACLFPFTEIIEQGGIAAECGRQRERIKFVGGRINGVLQVFARGLDVLDFAIEQADIAIRDIDAMAGAELLAQIESLQLAVERFGIAAHVAIDGAEVGQRLCLRGLALKTSGDIQCVLMMLQGGFEGAAATRDRAESGFRLALVTGGVKFARENQQLIGSDTRAVIVAGSDLTEGERVQREHLAVRLGGYVCSPLRQLPLAQGSFVLVVHLIPSRHRGMGGEGAVFAQADPLHAQNALIKRARRCGRDDAADRRCRIDRSRRVCLRKSGSVRQ